MTEVNENIAFETYNMYGNRQREFSYLPDWAQAEVIEYCHTIAIVTDEARGMRVVKVCADGFKITQAMVDEEVRRTRAADAALPLSRPLPRIIGVNASVNMFC